MFKNEILENENRRKIYTVIVSHPGIHLRELQRVLDIPLTTLDYHLSYMSQRNVVLREKNGAYMRYYAKPFDENDKLLFSALRQKRMREIVFLVLLNQKAKVKLLVDKLNLPRSTLSFYLKYLVEHNILEREKIGYENFYTVIDEDRIAKILITYRSSFIDKLVDKALNTWLETRFHRD